MKRQAYGYRDQEFFELKYYQCMTPSTDLSDKPFFLTLKSKHLYLYINKIYCTFALYKDNSNNKQ